MAVARQTLTMVDEGAWPVDWEARRSGEDCSMCGELGSEEKPNGVRVLDGHFVAGYLGRFPV